MNLIKSFQTCNVNKRKRKKSNMTTVELKKERQGIKDSLENLKNTLKTEGRLMTDEEKAELERSQKRISEIDVEIRSIEEKLQNIDSLFTVKEVEAEKRNNEVKTNKEKMDISLIKEIRTYVNTNTFSPEMIEMSKRGAEANQIAGQGCQGQISIPVEVRSGYTVSDAGTSVVANDITNLLEPLRAKNVLMQAGAKFITGLRNNVIFPSLGKQNVGWNTENGSAINGASGITSQQMVPHRLTAYIDISKQFLMQESADCERVIREDLVRAINSKLEATILGKEADDPANFTFWTKNATVLPVSGFSGICTVESTFEGADFDTANAKYLINPAAKGILRQMAKSTKSTQLVYEDGEIDSTPALVTSNVGNGTTDGNLIYGDFGNLVIGQWGSVDLSIDTVTKAITNEVRIVINTYFGVARLHPNAFVLGKVQ